MKLFFRLNIISIIILGVATQTNAQRSLPKWDNLAKEAETYKSDKAYSLYADYLSLETNSTRSSLYYRLGNHSLNILENMDPIVNASRFNNLANVTKGYYDKCLELLETGDFKKDRDYYDIPTVNKRLTEAEVKAKVDPKIEGINLFVEKTKEVQDNINALQKNYITVYNKYLSLNEKHINESGIYASWSSESEKELNDIVTIFSQVKEDIFNYRNSLIKQPTKGYAANYTYSNIENFRKDGIMVTGFTKGALWDYGTWASKTLNHYNENIKPVIDEANAKLAELNRDIDNYERKKSNAVVETDLYKKLFSIDPNNPMISKLKFKSNRLSFLTEIKNPLNNANVLSENLGTEKIDYLQKLTKNYSELSVKKYASYPYEDRFKDAILYAKALENIKEYVKNTNTSIVNTSNLAYKKEHIPLTYGTGFYRATTSGYLTKNIVPAPNGGIYICGSVVNEQGFAVAFTAYSNDEENITWLQTMDYSKMMYDDCAMAIHATTEGNCYVLVSSKSVSDPSLTSHSIVGYNNKGEEIQNLLLPEKILPLGRMIKYNQETKEFLLVFYGMGENWYEENAKLIVQKITADNVLKYRTEYPLNGSLVKMIEDEDKLILIGSSTYLKTNKNEYKTKLAAFTLFLKNGHITSEDVFERDKPYSIIEAFSTAKGISIIGQESQNVGGKTRTIYTQLNPLGDVIFTNKLPENLNIEEGEQILLGN